MHYSLSQGAWQCVRPREPFCSCFPPGPPHPDGAPRHIQVLGGILKPPHKNRTPAFQCRVSQCDSYEGNSPTDGDIVYAHKNRQAFNISIASIAADVASSPDFPFNLAFLKKKSDVNLLKRRNRTSALI